MTDLSIGELETALRDYRRRYAAALREKLVIVHALAVVSATANEAHDLMLAAEQAIAGKRLDRLDRRRELVQASRQALRGNDDPAAVEAAKARVRKERAA